MRVCGICRMAVDYVCKLFEEFIGEPPVLLSQVLLKCTRGTKREYIRGGICQTCTNDLCRYYEALQTAKEIRKKIITILEHEEDFEPNLNTLEEYPPNNSSNIQECEGDKEEQEESQQNQTECEENITQVEALDGEYVHEELFNDTEFIEENDREETLIETDHNEEDGSETEDEADENLPICYECGINFNNQRTFKQHKRTEHREKYVCEHCGKLLATQASLVKHVTLHNPNKPLACDVCGKRYHFEIDLNNHRAWHTGERPFKCQLCDKSYVNYMSLCCHKMTHKEIPDGIECEICNKKFRKRSRLKQHMYVHETIKRYKCIHCDYCTANKYSLSWHKKKNKKCFELYQRDRMFEEQALIDLEASNIIQE